MINYIDFFGYPFIIWFLFIIVTFILYPIMVYNFYRIFKKIKRKDKSRKINYWRFLIFFPSYLWSRKDENDPHIKKYKAYNIAIYMFFAIFIILFCIYFFLSVVFGKYKKKDNNAFIFLYQNFPCQRCKKHCWIIHPCFHISPIAQTKNYYI